VNGILIVAGIGAIALFQSTLTALLVEGVIARAFRRRRMDRRIERLNGHFVVAGCGRTGKFVVEELATVGRDFVAIDRDEALLERLSEEIGGKLLYVVGDATDDHTLSHAGIQRAAGLVAALSDDRDNLFVTLSTRTLNPKARIVTKAVELENEPKIMRAGADAIVSPNRMGGMRLVSELVRPKVMQFLDNMLTVTKNLRFEEVEIPGDSPWVGHTLRSVPIRDRTNLLVVALHLADGSYMYNPSPDHALDAGTQLIVMGESESVEKLRKLIYKFPA
jgi:voltage-gated potassium channel